MRITESVTYDWDGNVLESRSYDYDGPVSLCGGGGGKGASSGGDFDIPAPAPSPQPAKSATTAAQASSNAAKKQEQMKASGLAGTKETGPLGLTTTATTRKNSLIGMASDKTNLGQKTKLGQ